MKKPDELNPETCRTLDDLCDVYAAWMKRQGVTLGSADEHLTDESLTEEQQNWLAQFVRLWDPAQKWQDILCRRLSIEETPDRLRQYRVRHEGTDCPLLGFAVINDECPDVVDCLLSGSLGQPVPIPVHAGYDEATLLAVIENETDADDPWFRCICNNTPEHDGFIACDSQGKPQSEQGGGPLPEWDGQHHICRSCGAYFGRDLQVIGLARTAALALS